MKNRIGLAIVTYTINYGTYLQAFATQIAIEKMGYETEILNIESVIDDVSRARKKYFIKQIFNYAEVKSYSPVIKGIIAKRINKSYREYMKNREKMFSDFKDCYFKIGAKCDSWQGLAIHSKEFSSIIVGSDQLWRPANIEGNFYTLNFVPSEVNTISYATSFGLSKVRNNQRKKAADFLRKINYLSTREESGAKIVNELTGRDCKVVCDPTLLLKKSDWEKYVDSKPIILGNYVFAYLLSDNKECREYVKSLSKIVGCKVVGVLHGAGYIKGDEKFVDQYPTNIGPFEFLNLIKFAKYVCTDSFHGCVFSIIFEKEFFAFKRFSDSDKMSTNSRVLNLLDKFGLNDRIVADKSEFKFESINYENTNKLKEEFRQYSLKYLANALQKKEME